MMFHALLQRLAHINEQNMHLWYKGDPCIYRIQTRFNIGFQTQVGTRGSCEGEVRT